MNPCMPIRQALGAGFIIDNDARQTTVGLMQKLKLGRSGLCALVDDDFVLPKGGCLCLASTGYPVHKRSTGLKNSNGTYIYEQTYLHHLVIGKPPKGMEVDHINGDKLDARLSSLRICSRGQNARNIPSRKGKYLGVHRSSRQLKNGRYKFVAQITHEGKCSSLGSFDTELEAAASYNKAAASLHGEYARLNQLP